MRAVSADPLRGAQFGLAPPERVMRQAQLRDVRVRLEQRRRLALRPADRPTGKHDHLRAVAAAADEFALPAPVGADLADEARPRLGEFRRKKLVGVPSHRLLGWPAIEIRGAVAPIGDAIVRAAHEDRLMREIEQGGLLRQRLRILLAADEQERGGHDGEQRDRAAHDRIAWPFVGMGDDEARQGQDDAEDRDANQPPDAQRRRDEEQCQHVEHRDGAADRRQRVDGEHHRDEQETEKRCDPARLEQGCHHSVRRAVAGDTTGPVPRLIGAADLARVNGLPFA